MFKPAYLRALRITVVLALTASVLFAAIATLHWPIVGDAPLLHYNVFLHDHGLAPYRQVIDMNMPGTYALEWTAIHLYGPGPLAWRLFDYTLLLICGLAMVRIAIDLNTSDPENPAWLAGFFAAALFALVHLRDGPTHTGQRDLMMTTALLPACAALFYALRRIASPIALWPITLFGLCLGMATIIKPTGLFFAITLTAMLCIHLHKLQQPKTPPLLVATTAFCIPIAGCLLYLHAHHAIAALIGILRGFDAYHASLGRPSLAALIIGSFPSILLAVAIPAVPLFFATRDWRRWPIFVLIACTLLGCASYIFQGKGYPYHRYPTEAFLLLTIALVAFPLVTHKSWPRYFALLTILLGALFLAPASASIAAHFDGNNQEFNHMLADDLNTLGAQSLQHQIQCIDTTAGCANTLYNLQLVQATGYIYDCYLFQPVPNPVRDQYRTDFLAALNQAQPKILVVSNQECFTMNRSYKRLANWPAFTTLLANNYTLTTERTPPHTVGWWRHPAQPFSYRIYVRNR